MAEDRLEGDGRPRDRRLAAGVHGRDGHQHLPSPALRLVTEGRKGALFCAAQPRAQYHAAGEHNGRG